MEFALILLAKAGIVKVAAIDGFVNRPDLRWCSMRLRKVYIVLLVFGGLAIAGVGALFVVSLTAPRPDNLGVHDGQLAKAPESPNCVSTQTPDRSHWIAPLTFAGTPADAISQLGSVVSQLPGSTIIEQTDEYLYVEFRSQIFRFVDDVEFLVEPESARIHFRSASRVGHSDLGTNRNRMEQIRALFEAAQKTMPANGTVELQQSETEVPASLQ